MRRFTPTESDAGRAGAAGLVLITVLAVLGAGVYVWFRGSVGNIPIREHCTATASGNTSDLDPEQAGNAATIAGIAVKRKLPARAASIGIATAIQESKLRNIDYGDRDSLGLFQQRPSQGWGTRKEILDPVYSTNAFYDELSKIDGFETMPITDVAQKVQRSAFPSAYADHEPEARIWASALSGYSEAALSCVLRSPDPSASGHPDSLSGRLTTVTDAVAEELDSGIKAQTDGDALTFRYTGGEANRRSWSLAQWAVARASSLDVVSVAVDGKLWTRDEGPKGWVDDDTAAAGTVVVTVA